MYPSFKLAKTVQTLDNRQHRTEILEWGETREERPMIRPSVWRSTVHFPAGTDCPRRVQLACWVEEKELELEDWDCWKMWSKVLKRRELCRKKSLQTCMGCQVFCTYFCTFAQDTILLGWAKNNSSAVAEWFPELRVCWELFTFPPVKVEGSHWSFKAFSRDLRRIIP